MKYPKYIILPIRNYGTDHATTKPVGKFKTGRFICEKLSDIFNIQIFKFLSDTKILDIITEMCPNIPVSINLKTNTLKTSIVIFQLN